MSQNKQIDVSVIIVNYNTFNLTCSCIQSVIEKTLDTMYEVILVDNASTECQPELFVEKFPFVKLVKNDKNVGFAAGNNLGIKQASGKYFLLLNSDTQLVNNALTVLYKCMEINANAGAISGKLIYPNGKVQPVAGRFDSVSLQLMELFRITRFLSKEQLCKLYLADRFNYEREIECDWVWGAFYMIRPEIIQKFKENKLPDDFFMYAEDVQWCYQIRKLGYKVMFTPEPIAIHHIGGSDKDKTTEQEKYFARILPNRYKLLKMQRGRMYAFIFYFLKGIHLLTLRNQQDRIKAKHYFNLIFS